mmetsp:Transcript_7737/g.11276  ORF Transcript_7737/g.11276 Transcript_7737/m.11276 type:complete len:87 (-) Transcript_7737:414-674(-)
MSIDVLKLECSRKASYKGKKSEDRDEKKLESVRGKSEEPNVSINLFNGGRIDLALRRSGEERREGDTLLPLNFSKAVFVEELSILS